MRRLFFLFLAFPLPLALQAQGPATSTPEHSITVHSHVLAEDRVCHVGLPDSYQANPDQQYPVIILLDGKAYFKITTGVVHFMSSVRNRNNMMPESIVVAVENVDRERDFTVTRVPIARENNSGGGTNFLRFLEEELIPYLDQQYRTAPHRTLIGHSLGGLLTVSAYLRSESLFDAYLAIDPAIWWEEELMAEKVAAANGAILTRPFFLATANQGPDKVARNQARHEQLVDMIHDATQHGSPVVHKYYPDEDHRSVPLPALYYGLQYLHPRVP